MAVNNRFVCICAGLIMILACNKPKQPGRFIDERFTLSATDKKPFGGYVARFMTDTLFGAQNIAENGLTFNKWYDDFVLNSDNQRNEVYIIFSPAVRAFSKEADDMRSFVSKGNTLLLVTDELSKETSDALGCEIADDAESLPMMVRLQMVDTRLSIADSSAHAMLSYPYFYYPFLGRTIVDSNKTDSIQWLGQNAAGKPHIARYTIGNGQVIVASNARALSNYFLLNAQNHAYLKALLSYLPEYPSKIHWDLFYQRNINRQPEDYSVFSALMAIPPLRWSFWILLALAAIWILSNLRRKQKMIPIVAPNTNTTVSFVQTIAQLYFNKQDHANVGRKLATHFTDYLRNNYYMPPLTMQAEWAYILHQKTGMSMPDAQETTRLIRKAQQSNDFSASDLMHLHSLIADVVNRKQKKATHQ